MEIILILYINIYIYIYIYIYNLLIYKSYINILINENVKNKKLYLYIKYIIKYSTI